MALYSKQIYWPKEIESELRHMFVHGYKLRPTRHYESKCKLLNLPYGCYKSSLYGDIIEAEIQEGYIGKIVTRIQSKRYIEFDMCFAIQFDNYDAIIKTVWLNRHDDNHITIDESKYVKEIKNYETEGVL